jgi:hypothetical protein
MVDDTKPLEETQKCCSKCGILKPLDRIVKNRNICKDCCNLKRQENYNAVVISNENNKTCSTCSQLKPENSFLKNRIICKDCNNEKRKNKYKTNETHRLKAIQSATEFKQQKAEERRKMKLDEIGEGNKKCSGCFKIKSSERFRHNRLKCKDCERDEPICKFKRNVRSRIYIALKQNKEMRTVKYLGCTSSEYLEWLLTYDEKYTLENRGTEWHIDHVIPLSKFNLEDKEEQLIAFNWRNTMPLAAKENLSKNTKIILSQIEQHYKKLVDYHLKNKKKMPQEFIDLFAKHLVDGNTLKHSLPLTTGNVCEDLG